MLEVFDTESRQLMTVHQGASLLGMSISPDGQWLTYIPWGTLPTASQRRAPGLSIFVARPQLGGWPEHGVVYLVQTSNPANSVEVGYCGGNPDLPDIRDEGCRSKITWTPDSTSFVWADTRGIWLYRREQESQLTIANQTYEDGYLLDSYLPIAWSPQGRYLRVSKIHNLAMAFEVVLDTTTGHIANFPYRLGFDIPSPKIEWLEDGRLLVTQDVVPSVRDIWRIDPTSESLLVLDSGK